MAAGVEPGSMATSEMATIVSSVPAEGRDDAPHLAGFLGPELRFVADLQGALVADCQGDALVCSRQSPLGERRNLSPLCPNFRKRASGP